MEQKGSGSRLGGRLLIAAALAGAPVACSLLTSFNGLTAEPGARDGGSTDARPPDAMQTATDSGAPAETGGSCDGGRTVCGVTCMDLTVDPENCGRCGRDCLGGACTMGACDAIVLATGQSTPGAIITVQGALYWGNASEIMRCSLPAEADADAGTDAGADSDADLDDASPPDAIAPDANTPDGGALAATCAASVTSYRSAPSGGLLAFATDETRLYWLDAFDLWKCPLGAVCATETPLVLPYARYTSPAVQGRGVQLGAGASALYWPGPGGIEACAVAGCSSMSSFAAPTTSGLVLAGGTAYWGAGQAILDCAAASATCPAPAPFVTVPAPPFYLASDGTTLYWTEQATDGGVRSCPLAGCATPALVAGGQATPTLITADSSGVYWINSGSPPAIMGCSPGGCTSPTVLWTGAYTPAGIAVDSRAVYFTLPGAGTVMAVAKL